MTSGLDFGVAAGAGILAGGINALAGGGSLVSFPALQFIGLPSIDANVTNIVALTPGYVSGSYGQRRDLEGQAHQIRYLGLAAGLGGLIGSILLVTVAANTFKVVVPYLILLACGALAVQARVRRFVESRRQRVADGTPDGGVEPTGSRSRVEWATVFVCSLYGGFFGAGLGIMLLAVLGFFSADTLIRINALKQVLSFVVSLLAASFLSFTGHVDWSLAGVVAGASLIGGFAGGRFVRHVNPNLLRALVICYGVAVAIHYWV